jgi:hypothetical protein
MREKSNFRAAPHWGSEPATFTRKENREDMRPLGVRLPVGCVRAIDYYLSPPPYSMSDIQEMIKADEDPTDFLESNDPRCKFAVPAGASSDSEGA